MSDPMALRGQPGTDIPPEEISEEPIVLFRNVRSCLQETAISTDI